MLGDVWLARTINQQCGGVVVAPWEVQDLPEAWLDVFRGVALDLPVLQAQQRAINERFEKMRREHPTYKK